MKKITGIFLCVLFLILTMPSFSSATLEKINDVTLQKTDNSLILGIVYGKIVYNGEETLDEPFGKCYNVTPINVRIIVISIFEKGFNIQKDEVWTNPLYISQNMSHGFVGKHFLFLYGWSNTI